LYYRSLKIVTCCNAFGFTFIKISFSAFIEIYGMQHREGMPKIKAYPEYEREHLLLHFSFMSTKLHYQGCGDCKLNKVVVLARPFHNLLMFSVNKKIILSCGL
jgi:hypothetical protein